MTGRVIIVANRLPVSVAEDSGRLSLRRSPGGLATALAAVFDQYQPLWVGWTGLRRKATPHELRSLQLPKKLIPINLAPSDVVAYYDRFANGNIWPVFHGFAPHEPLSPADWRTVQKVTATIAATVKEALQPDDVIWIHDYHLALLPHALRTLGVANRIGFFLHIPFPPKKQFTVLPHHKTIAKSLAQADVLGMQTARDVANFTAYATTHNVAMRGTVKAFPIGIDTALYRHQPPILPLKNGNTTHIASISRLDYTKGIINQLAAVELLLAAHPQPQNITYELVVAPSREASPEYHNLKHTIAAEAARINSRFGTANWQPVHYTYRNFNLAEVAQLYHRADILLTTPLADGMNLVVKEYIATRHNNPGMLVMTRSTGAAAQLAEALLVGPGDPPATARALAQALAMPAAERQARWDALQATVQQQDIFWWTRLFLTELTAL